MGIGKIFTKTAAYLSHTKAANVLRSGIVRHSAQSNILSRIETNTPGRILRMQEAKDAFRPTQVTYESVPTLQKIEEITGVTRGKVKDETGFFDLKRVAEASIAFRRGEPIKLIYSGGSCAKSVPTQKAIDDMLGIVEDTPKARLELLRKRAEIRDAFKRYLSNLY